MAKTKTTMAKGPEKGSKDAKPPIAPNGKTGHGGDRGGKNGQGPGKMGKK